jgi:hypothetical protein
LGYSLTPVRIPNKMVPISVFIFGGFRNRNPLAYPAIRERLGDRVALVDAPDDADILLISHFSDVDLFGQAIHSMLRRCPGLRLVLFSEEPFWDSCAMPDPFSRIQRFPTYDGVIDCVVLNHETTQMYRAEHIPYFLLTDPRYIAHYRPLFDRNAGWSVEDWVTHFTQARIDAVYLAGRRHSPNQAPDFGDDRMRGLSVWRSHMADACQGHMIIREGAGWSSGPRRQDLADWHSDKLQRFDLQVRYMSAFENTHQRNYISEKIWDAFAVGSVPLYVASKTHALHRLIGSAGWLNFHEAVPTAIVFVADTPVDLPMAASYAAQQHKLAKLFANAALIDAEYSRFCDALLAELDNVRHSAGL